MFAADNCVRMILPHARIRRWVLKAHCIAAAPEVKAGATFDIPQAQSNNTALRTT